MIPMRDGVKLHAVILKPSDVAEPLPFLIQRTPYGVDGTDRASFFANRPELAARATSTFAKISAGATKERGAVSNEPGRSQTIAIPKQWTKTPMHTTRWPGCLRTFRATMDAPALWVPAIQVSWPRWRASTRTRR